MKSKFIMMLVAICFVIAPVANAITIDGTYEELRVFFGGNSETLGGNGEMLGGTTNYDSLALEDDGTIYFNNGTGSYGIRDNSGVLQFKNENGSWASLGATPIAGGGWIADANNWFEYPTANLYGAPYPIILGGNATTSAWVGTDELFINGSFTSTGAANIDGAINVAGASALVGAVTITGNSTAAGTWGVTGAVVHANTLAQQGVATFTADPIIGGTTPKLTIGDAGTEDTSVVFDGQAQDFYIGLFETVVYLKFVVGNALGTTPAISIAEDLATVLSGTINATAAVDFDSTLNVDGAMTAAAITTDGAFITTSNITGVNGVLSGTLTVGGDFIFDTNTIYGDVSANKVGFGTTTPLTEWVEISDGFLVFDSTGPYDVLIHGYDSDDDGVLDILANGTAAIKLHANDDSYILGGGFGIGTTTACGISVGDASPSTACAGDDDAYVEGTLEVDGAVDFDGAVAIAGVLTPTTITNNTGSIVATTTLTAASPNINYLAASAVQTTITLPAVADGLWYKFVVTGALTATVDTVITTAGSANIIFGALMTGGVDYPCTVEDAINVIVDGELPGDWFRLESDGTNWYITGSTATTDAKLTCTT